MTEARCNLCGEPMPAGEEMFNYHGHSGPCPKPPLMKATQDREAIYKIAWDTYVDKSMDPAEKTIDCIKRVVDAVMAARKCRGCDGHECDEGCQYPGVSRT